MPYKDKLRQREWHRNNHEYKRKYYIDHREYFRESDRKWSEENRERRREIDIKANLKLKMSLLEILGFRCSNPNCLVPGGCTDIRCLQVDHINGGGSEHRRNTGFNSRSMYRYYIKHLDYAKTELQILCANCNWIKRHENKEWGHKKNN